MKRILSLLFLGIFLLCGCSGNAEEAQDSIHFYYVRSAYREDMTSLIESEPRDAAGHEDDLSYLLALYLIGPSSDDLICPIPADTELLSATLNGRDITIKLSDTEKTMSEPQFALSCACLSMTCLDMANAESVTVISGTRTITMTRDNLSLTDNTIITTEDTP